MGRPIADSESTCYSGGRSEVPKFLAPPPQTRRDSVRHSSTEPCCAGTPAGRCTPRARSVAAPAPSFQTFAAFGVLRYRASSADMGLPRTVLHCPRRSAQGPRPPRLLGSVPLSRRGMQLFLRVGLLAVLGAAVACADDFEWIQKIATGPAGQKVQLQPRTYLIDKQYQLPRGTELRGAGTALGHRTVVKAVGSHYNACAGTASAPGLIQGRKGILLGDDTFVGGLHLVGMETTRLDCLYGTRSTITCGVAVAGRLSCLAAGRSHDRDARMCEQRGELPRAAERDRALRSCRAQSQLLWGIHWQRRPRRAERNR